MQATRLIALVAATLLMGCNPYAENWFVSEGGSVVPATIMALDQARREVTISTEDRGAFSLPAGPKVRNLSQLAAGRGDCGGCWCMWWRLTRADFAANSGAEHKAGFAARVAAGPPPGLIGYDAYGAPVGWVQVGPRADAPLWNEPGRLTAPLDPAEADDPGVWSVTCFVVRAGRRRRGHGGRLLDAAIAHAGANAAAPIGH